MITIGCGGTESTPAGSADGGGGGGTGGSGGGGQVGSLGPIGLKNASARALGQGDYSITFVLQNPEASQGRWPIRVDLVRFKWDTTTLNFPYGCQSEPWVTTSDVSAVITVGLYITSSTGSNVTAQCSGSSGSHQLGPALPLPSTSIGLEVDGVLNDATPFTATATAPIL